MHKQKGVTFLGMVLVAIVIILVAIVGLRLFPAYLEYQTIKDTVKRLVTDPELKGATASQIKKSFDRHAVIDNITAIGPEDLDISIENGQATIKAEYAKKVPLFANVNFCIDFSVRSDE